ncbi:YeeE/YedE thiosulfate transporter family protein [Massilia sp. MS-15]|uniref:YeeE/YedE thiosulfate transporter family protein n=1 Tax=Massilia sp. MS-15 TaxID=2878200 RepID=UPI001CD63EF0|nr:YeeE/YedE thiosulfate transporter family protein [Massilia sp. MS-15]MCA1245947.1 YeeE/YedE family protein [Massilia sp. MS-15]
MDKEPQQSGAAAEKSDAPKQLVLGLLFGIVFGFLLQKGGVAKYDVLLGALLLTDFTVMKIMLSAILVGMIGIFGMHALGLVKLQLKPTKYAANVIGGLIFGAGFALIGYCPGTGAAALGQGNLDAVAGIAGLLAGSYLYAELSGNLSKNVLAWGDRGCIQLPDLIGVRTMPFLIVFAPFLGVALWLLHLYFP